MHAASSNMDDLTLVSDSIDCFLLRLTSVANFVHVSTLFRLISQHSFVPAPSLLYLSRNYLIMLWISLC